MLTPAQIRAARALLVWSGRVLAERASVHITTVQRLERGGPRPRGHVETVEKIRQALEAAGVEFGAANGIRLKEPEG